MTDQLPVLRSRTVPAVAPQPAIEADAVLSVELRKAHMIAKSGDAIPKSYRGNDGAILLAMDWAAKRGLDLITALQSVSFVNGRPVIDATMQRALARQAGYRVTVSDAASHLGHRHRVRSRARSSARHPSPSPMPRPLGSRVQGELEELRRGHVGRPGHDQGDPTLRSGCDGGAVHRGRRSWTTGRPGSRRGLCRLTRWSMEVDSGRSGERRDSSTGTADAGSTPEPVISQHEAVLRPKMRGDILGNDRPARPSAATEQAEGLDEVAKGWVLVCPHIR